MPKQVQIDFELFLDLYSYFFGENAPEGDDANEIRRALDEKAERIINRELFTRYKRAPTGEEREQARRAYLDRRGIFRARTDSECPLPEPPTS